MSGLTPAAALALAQLCAPHVHPSTLLSVAWTESGWAPAIVHHNRNGTADYGVTQINESNLRRLGLTRDSALDPCLSMRAAARVLIENYHPIDGSPGAKRAALRRTIAAYNAGPAGGPNPGYVEAVVAASRYVVPAIGLADSAASPPMSPSALSSSPPPVSEVVGHPAASGRELVFSKE